MPVTPKSIMQKSSKTHPHKAKSVTGSSRPSDPNERSVWAIEYKKYFAAPTTTPQGFHILDLSDGGSITTSSHT
jgi:hypothetical protein